MTEQRRAGHTPGPWGVAGHLVVAGVENRWVAQTYCKAWDYPVPKDEAIANAKLIAAAPRLLAAAVMASRAVIDLTCALSEELDDPDSETQKLVRVGNEAYYALRDATNEARGI